MDLGDMNFQVKMIKDTGAPGIYYCCRPVTEQWCSGFFSILKEVNDFIDGCFYEEVNEVQYLKPSYKAPSSSLERDTIRELNSLREYTKYDGMITWLEVSYVFRQMSGTGNLKQIPRLTIPCTMSQELFLELMKKHGIDVILLEEKIEDAYRE